jgi:NADH-quinone oxidoreductase subunit C
MSEHRDQKGMFGVSGSGDTSGYGGLVRAVSGVDSSQRPFGSYFDDVADSLERVFPQFHDAIERIVVEHDEMTLHVRRERVLEVARVLRDDPTLRFEVCLGVS